MTSAVLYTLELEPITVIDVPMWAWERLRRGDHLVFAVPETPSLRSMREQPSPALFRRRTVSVFAERLHRQGSETLMLFTANDELALALQCSFLPGQRGEVQRRERAAEMRGLIEGMFLNPR